MPIINCSICNKTIKVQPKRLKRALEVTCSRECSDLLKSKRTIKKLEDDLGISNLKEWLVRKYIDEKLSMRRIAILMYGSEKSMSSVRGWLKKFEIETRVGSEAIKLQWENNEKRREEQRRIAKKKLVEGEGREKLKRIMRTDAYRAKSSNSKLGIKNPMFGVFGEKHHQWNPERTKEQRVAERKTAKDKPWRKAVFERDSYTCQCCGDDKGGNLRAHHIDSYDWCEEKRHDVKNGITLCEDCHKHFHRIYGYGGNNQAQFLSFLNKFNNRTVT